MEPRHEHDDRVHVLAEPLRRVEFLQGRPQFPPDVDVVALHPQEQQHQDRQEHDHHPGAVRELRHDEDDQHDGRRRRAGGVDRDRLPPAADVGQLGQRRRAGIGPRRPEAGPPGPSWCPFNSSTASRCAIRDWVATGLDSRSLSQCRTIPACDSVNERKTPMA